jgi:biopolymer transport protein ExbD
MNRIFAGLVSCAAFAMSGCGKSGPPVVEYLVVSIDARNNCSMADQPVECARAAAAIQSRYPTSKPRVDICLHKESRFEAAVEVMNSIRDAGLTVGSFACGPVSKDG